MEQRQHIGDSSHTISTTSQENDKQGNISQWITSKLPPSLQDKIPQRNPDNAAPRPNDRTQDYLTGCRGVLVPMAFLWTFLQTFAPTAVKGNNNTTGPDYQIAFGKSLSVLFWNNTLIYSSIIFLSARTICLPFLLEPTKTVLASSVFRRGLKLWFPVAACLIVVRFVYASLGNQYLEDFVTLTDNTSMVPGLYLIPSSLANFNAIFEIFWVSHVFQSQAGNWAFPTQMLWVISALFQQSYTVYMTMVIIPYTRQKWRVLGAVGFILTAWWVYSWAFYSIAGLLVADAVMNMDLRPGGSGASFHVFGVRVSFWIVGLICFLAGFALQFIWVAAAPQLENAELMYHTGLYNTGGINRGVDTSAAQMRADCWLIVVGFQLMLESSAIMQAMFRSRFLVFLGKRSFSWFLLQSIIIYTLGITVATNIMGGDMSNYTRATGVAFIASLLVTIPAAEILYWLVDRPSQWFGRVLFDWIRD